MTSKKALQKLFSLTHCNGCKNNLKCINENLCYTYLTIINQDLERLEKLEKQNKLLNETKDSVYKVLEDLGKINEENAKLKKAIEILKQYVDISKRRNEVNGHFDICCIYSFGSYKDITQQKYELLKEVLEND